MGLGGRGRGGSTSRKESTEGSKEKKESKPSEGNLKISADEIRKLVAKFLKEQASNTNPRKALRLLNKISEETVRALGFMSKLKYVTVLGASRLPVRGVACRVGSSIIKNASPKKRPFRPAGRPAG